MAERRKHRLVVEVTFSVPLTERDARKGLSLVLGDIDTDANPVWTTGDVYVDKLTVKEFSRVVRTL